MMNEAAEHEKRKVVAGWVASAIREYYRNMGYDRMEAHEAMLEAVRQLAAELEMELKVESDPNRFMRPACLQLKQLLGALQPEPGPGWWEAIAADWFPATLRKAAAEIEPPRAVWP